MATSKCTDDPQTCQTCYNVVGSEIEKYMKIFGNRSEADVVEHIIDTFGWAPITCVTLAVRCCNGMYAVTVDERIYSIEYLAQKELSKSRMPQNIKMWGDKHGIPFDRLQSIIHDTKINGVHIYKDNYGHYNAKMKTILSAHNKATLEKAIRRQGTRGTQLATVYAEYENAYADIMDSTKFYIDDGLVWHISYTAGLP